MSGGMRSWARDTAELAPVVEEADPGFFEHRAMLAFRALAVIYLAGIVLAFFPEPNTIPLLRAIVFNGAALVLAIVYLVIARDLRRMLPWAVAVARPILVLVIVEDLAGFLLSLAAGHIRGLPIATVIAVWALLGPAGLVPVPRPNPMSWLSLGLAAPMLAILVIAPQVFGWGGPFDVQPSDLVSNVQVSCASPGGSPDTGGEPPDRIRVTYDWAWTKGSPVPNGLDIVVIGWTGDDAQGRPLYFLGPSLPTEPGIYDGRRAYPSLEMGNAVAAASEGSWQWGIELEERGLRPGRIELDLERARAPAPDSEPLRILVSYVHLGLWHVDTPVTCEW